jgi:phage tail sheath gpL-like
VEVSGALAGDTLNLFGYVFTATDAANPVAPLWNKTAAGLAAAITAQRGWLVTAAVAGNEITLTSVMLGATGNEITLATNAAARVILSGATLTGGTGISTQTPLW